MIWFQFRSLNIGTIGNAIRANHEKLSLFARENRRNNLRRLAVDLFFMKNFHRVKKKIPSPFSQFYAYLTGELNGNEKKQGEIDDAILP